MAPLPVLLSLLATLLLHAATAGETPRGPWMVYDGAGGAAVIADAGVELSAGGATMPAVDAGRLRRWQVAAADLDGLAAARAGAATPLPLLRPAATVRLAVLGGRRWPDRADLARLAEALGGPLGAALRLDPQPIADLGAGGWEADLPILLAAGPRRVHRLGALALVGPGGPPALDGVWTVLIGDAPGYDPGVLAGARAELAPTVAAAVAAGCPLALLPGSGATVLSDPLRPSGGGLVAAAGGARVLVHGGGLDPPWRLDPEIARWADRPALCGIVADAAALELVLIPVAGDGLALRWRWDRTPAADAAPGPAAHAHADGTRLAAAAGHDRAGDPAHGGGRAHGDSAAHGGEAPPSWGTATAAILDPLTDLPWPDLLARHLAVEDLDGLIARSRDEPAAAALLGRLVLDPTALSGRSYAVLPPTALRDAILRDLAAGPAMQVERWAAAAAAADDPPLLRALLRAADEHPPVLAALVAIAERIAAGARPPPADARMQLRLMGAVFDSAYLSPTPLRPIAREIGARLDPLARGPVERFLARHGRFRPMDQPPR